MPFPDVTFPPETDYRSLLDKLQRFFVSARKYWLGRTDNDFILTTSGKGVILTNAAGTITKRIRLNNTGNGIIIEDV